MVGHEGLELIGVTDQIEERDENFSSFHSVPKYASLDALLDDKRVQLVLNLTNPSSHYEVSRRCLEAGKHVYSEKPLAMRFEQAAELVELAESKRLLVGCAPCGVLSEAAQTTWHLLRKGKIGKVRLAYAELDDGLIHRMRYRQWHSTSGVPWPWKDEFEVGCTLEHAAYYVTWLCAFFGPARTVTSFASCQIQNKETDLPLDSAAPDFSSACIEFHTGVVARITCSIIAPHDHQLRIFGDEGALKVKECWDYLSPVYLRRFTPWSLRLEKWPWISRVLGLSDRKYKLNRIKEYNHRYRSKHSMDFSRGVADLVQAAENGSSPNLKHDFLLHVNEIVLTIQCPELMGCSRSLVTTFEELAPLSSK